MRSRICPLAVALFVFAGAAHGEGITFRQLEVSWTSAGTPFQDTVNLGQVDPYASEKLITSPTADVPGTIEWVPGFGMNYMPIYWVSGGKPASPDIPEFTDAADRKVVGGWVEYDLTRYGADAPQGEDPFLKVLHFALPLPNTVPDSTELLVRLTTADASVPYLASLSRAGDEWFFSAFPSASGGGMQKINISDYVEGTISIHKPEGTSGLLAMTLHSKSNPAVPDVTFNVQYYFGLDDLLEDPFEVGVPVPEPATMCLLGLGSTLVALQGRRGRRR